MRICMLSMGSVGDVRPCLLLGKELRARGHQVTVAAFPQFRDMITAAGLAFFPLGGNSEEMINAIMQPDTNGLTYLPRLMKNLSAIIPDLIRSLTESCAGAEAMVCNYFGSVYYSIAEMYGIPCVQINFFPMDPTGEIPISSVRNQHLGKYMNLASYRMGYLLISLVEKHYLTNWRKDRRLDKRKIQTKPDYTAGVHSVSVIYAISPSLLQRPREWDERIHMSGFLFDNSPEYWQPPAPVREFVENGPKPVYIGFGSMNAGNMNKLLTIILRSVRAAGIRAVICLVNTGRKLTSNHTVCFIDEYVPHDWLFPRVSAVVHHGGAGTTAAGLRYGRPTLVIPFAGDQPFWGNLVHQAGCGPKPVPREKLSVRKLTEGLIDLVSKPSYSANAETLAGKMEKECGVKSAADLIEKEITGGR